MGDVNADGMASAKDGKQTRIERAYFASSISEFVELSSDAVLGQLTRASEFPVDLSQRDAWLEELCLLQDVLRDFCGRGQIYLEFVIPRLGKRVDALLLLGPAIFVIEFKVGATTIDRQALDQVWDYALDLKNFHESSHSVSIAPVLVITGRSGQLRSTAKTHQQDGVLAPYAVSGDLLAKLLNQLLGDFDGGELSAAAWEQGRYRPTPTIVEAAAALYRGHAVADISRNDAGAINLTRTSAAVAGLIESAQRSRVKSLCLVTGVPGAGKTLVGLDVATRFQDPTNSLHSVYLSGNGPLVAILREALARDEVERAKRQEKKLGKGEARQAVKAFIQPVHHFRDECLKDGAPPPEHVAIFDEAQRAWNLEKTADFMKRRKGRSSFAQSEPDFLISCLDRHVDWAVVVCLIGGGQEINTGEAGISEWIRALRMNYPDWHLHLSSHLSDTEYAADGELEAVGTRPNVHFNADLHLSASMRSFRAEHLSMFVKLVLDIDIDHAAKTYAMFSARYPIVITRRLDVAKAWIRKQARGSERYGIVVSSQAQRLKPHAIDVRTPVDPVNWFLNGSDDVRSSYYLEDVATEFQVQGLELDWSCVVWDADFRYSSEGWHHHSFVGNRWQRVQKADRRAYLKNAYRVLLTRARQGMVIVVPEGDQEDPTRCAGYYDPTFEYLKGLGLTVL